MSELRCKIHGCLNPRDCLSCFHHPDYVIQPLVNCRGLSPSDPDFIYFCPEPKPEPPLKSTIIHRRSPTSWLPDAAIREVSNGRLKTPLRG